jgi:hypothetical protein
LHRFLRAVCESTSLILLAWTVTACTTWVAETPPEFAMEQGSLKGPVRVLLSDSTIVDLFHVRVSADSVFGTVGSNGDSQSIAIVRSRVIAVDRAEHINSNTPMSQYRPCTALHVMRIDRCGNSTDDTTRSSLPRRLTNLAADKHSGFRATRAFLDVLAAEPRRWADTQNRA